MYKNTPIFVKVDLFLHENEFDSLRDFIQNFEPEELNFYDSIDYCMEKNTIHIIPLIPYESQILPDIVDFKKFEKLSSGYILLTIDTLEKFLSM